MARNFVPGSSQYLSTSSPPVITPPFTFACWFRPANLGAGLDRTLMALSDGAGSNYHVLRLTSAGVIGVFSLGTGLSSPAGTGSNGVWAHAAGVWTSQISRTGYLNGVAGAPNTTSSTPAGIVNFAIGRVDATTGQYMDGDIGDGAAWNVGLDTLELAALAAGVSPLLIRPTALVGYWPLYGQLSPETDLMRASALTVTGATAATSHPRVFLAAPSSMRRPAKSTYVAPTDPLLSVYIGGVDHTLHVDKYNTEITDQLNDAPNTATVLARSITPRVGLNVAIRHNGVMLFDGLVTGYTQVQPRTGTRTRYRLQCSDWTFLLDRRLVTKKYSSQAADVIAADILANFTVGFTSANVQAGLTTVDFPCKMETVSQALTRLANLAGAFWYIDYDRDLHFRTSENLTNPATLDTTNKTFKRLEYTKDGQQIRDRVLVEGYGSTASAAVAVGATTIPLDDASMFSASGGTVIIGSQIVTYTGVTTSTPAAARPAPSAAPTAVRVASGFGTPDETGNWSTEFSFVYSDGFESTPSAASANVNITGPNDGIALSNVLVGDARVTKRWIYEKKPSSGVYAGSVGQTDERFRINDNVTTTVSISAQTLGSTVNPLSTPANYPAGSTYIYVTDTASFSGTGGTARSGSQTFTYTGRSTSSGVGALTGIPSGGAGSISSTITVGDGVVASAGGNGSLTGIPASGVGSILYAVNLGDDVNILVTRNDTTAQSTMASLEGGDGIREHYIRDRRLSTAGGNARGDAELTLGKDPDEQATFVSEDANVFSGRSVTLNISGISTTLKIQRVQFAWMKGRKNPLRTVNATNRFKDFYQYVRDLEDQARQTP